MQFAEHNKKIKNQRSKTFFQKRWSSVWSTVKPVLSLWFELSHFLSCCFSSRNSCTEPQQHLFAYTLQHWQGFRKMKHFQDFVLIFYFRHCAWSSISPRTALIIILYKSALWRLPATYLSACRACQLTPDCRLNVASNCTHLHIFITVPTKLQH